MRIFVVDSSSSGAGDNSVALALLSVLRFVSRLPLQARPLPVQKRSNFRIRAILQESWMESPELQGWARYVGCSLS